jgi:hypothetical protein
MGLAARVTNHVVMSFTLNETQRKAVINTTYQSRQDVRKLEDWFEMQHPCFLSSWASTTTHATQSFGLRPNSHDSRNASGLTVS